MHKFVRSFITEWRKHDLPLSDETIVLAVSGGADSVSLMLAVHELVNSGKLRLRVIVAHFNHRLRADESEADEKFVRELASQLDLEFVAGSGKLPRKGNLEQNAREVRYQFLSKTARSVGAFAVLTGHTQNDQAETFLMNLIRGSGPDGLSGMSSVRKLVDRTLLVRPMLSWASRAATEEYCTFKKAGYRKDAMNDDQAFTRVRIRKTILPMLAEVNPKIVETLARTSELMNQGLRTGTPIEAAESDELSVSDLKLLKKPELLAALRAWLRGRRGNLRALELKHIEAVERLISSRKSGKTVELPGGGRVVKQGGRLTFAHIKVEK